MNLLEHLVEKSWSALGSIIRFLLIDLLIDVVLNWLGYGVLKLLKLVTGGRYPAGEVAAQSENKKVAYGVVALLLLFMLWLWLNGMLQ